MHCGAGHNSTHDIWECDLPISLGLVHATSEMPCSMIESRAEVDIHPDPPTPSFLIPAKTEVGLWLEKGSVLLGRKIAHTHYIWGLDFQLLNPKISPHPHCQFFRHL